MNCKNCGYTLFENEQYCRNCGNHISVQNTQINYQQQNNYTNLSISNNSNKCKLTLRRKKAFVASLVAFEIYIDNVKVGKIKNGQTIEVEITIGNHEISINKNTPVSIVINKDTTVDVVVFGLNNYGISNIDEQNTNNIENNYVKKNEDKTNLIFYTSIILPIISLIMFLTINFYITHFVYALFMGCAIINVFGLKKLNLNNSKKYKSLLSKNIIAIILLAIAIIVTIINTINY